MKKKAEEFDFEAFSREAIERLKAGDSMIGSNGIFIPLPKRLIETAMEGEMDGHKICKLPIVPFTSRPLRPC